MTMPCEPYNLLREAWIPVLRKDGSRADIRPCQISEKENPPVALAASRPDFNGALIQFLIGLVQTAFAPRTERDWRKLFNEPPAPDKLDKDFDPYARAFNLDGDGPRFMQDYEFSLDPPEMKPEDIQPVTHLLLETPTGKTLDDNNDHFIKARSEKIKSKVWRTDQRFSQSEVAMALLTMQLNAPGGGAGYKVSLRGMGPLTTVVIGPTLWSTVWLNVLPRRDFEALGGRGRTSESVVPPWIFPWMPPPDGENPAATSQSDTLTTPHAVHAAQMYWAMPRRKLLLREPDGTYASYYREVRGIDYDNESAWLHPLAPQKGKRPAKVESALSYSDWSSLATMEGADGVQPALVVSQFYKRFADRGWLKDESERSEKGDLGFTPRLWSFGYHIVNNNKTQAYHEVEMRLFVVPPAMRPNFEEFANQLVGAADEAANALRPALKKALFGTWKKDKGKWDYPTSKESASTKQESARSQIADVPTRFWRGTEQEFYAKLEEAKGVLNELPDAEYEEAQEALEALRGKWYDLVREHILDLFDEVTLWGTFRASNPRSVGRARRDLSTQLPRGFSRANSAEEATDER